jgi:hypothetical protein
VLEKCVNVFGNVLCSSGVLTCSGMYCVGVMC